MPERPILKLPNPRAARRPVGNPRNIPQPRGPGYGRQRDRFDGTFDVLAGRLDRADADIALRQDPAGIAPERALVFETAGPIGDFAAAARNIGLEVIAEIDLEDTDEIPEGFAPQRGKETLSPVLYATIPTLEVLNNLLRMWRAYAGGEAAEYGDGRWWKLFDLLTDLRVWGPQDRLSDTARAVIEDRLPANDDEEAIIELEIWPSANAAQRDAWRAAVRDRVAALGGRVIDACSIGEQGFIYEALLVGLTAGAVRDLLNQPDAPASLAMLDGVQFILPQTIAQSLPIGENDDAAPARDVDDPFHPNVPIRAALLDGTPIAAHAALDGGVIVEDLHDLVRLSQVEHRRHATSMASLILRGDLDGDGAPLADARIVSVPVLVDTEQNAVAPGGRLFVDVMHSTLQQLVGGDEPLAPDVFVVNLSIGIKDMRFAGRMSALARLLDWWAEATGLLFVISAGNISDRLILRNVRAMDVEDAQPADQRRTVRQALREAAYDRGLLAPSEAINGLTSGAVSMDLNHGNRPPHVAGIVRLEEDGDGTAAISSAVGLGPLRSIKPDLLCAGGIQEVRVVPAGDDAAVTLVEGQRTGLVVAAPPQGGNPQTKKARGTSCAAALTTRAVLQCAHALVGEDGPYEGLELPRRDMALLTRALAVNASQWPPVEHDIYREALEVAPRKYARAKEDVARYLGHGVIASERMLESPQEGATLVGLGNIRKDGTVLFDVPLPDAMAGERVARSMRVTLAWFSPMDVRRVAYRLASLEAFCADGQGGDKDNGWGLRLKGSGPDSNMVKRGSVWSQRLVHAVKTVPDFDEGASLPLCVQCRDASRGGLNQDLDIRFAIAVTLEVEAGVEFDVHQQIQDKLRQQVRGQV